MDRARFWTWEDFFCLLKLEDALLFKFIYWRVIFLVTHPTHTHSHTHIVFTDVIHTLSKVFRQNKVQ